MNVIVFMHIFFKACEFEMMSGGEQWINPFYTRTFTLYFAIDSEKYREVLISFLFMLKTLTFSLVNTS